MAPDASTARATFRPWQDLRWITGGVVFVFVGWLGWNLFGPEPAIVVSRETTYLTEPLAADGLPDYMAAALALHGPAPKPEENAAAGLLEVCWPLGIEAGDLPAVCRAIGIPNEPPAEPLREPAADAAARITSDMCTEAASRPWTGEEFPAIEAWVVKNSAAIDRVVDALKRPRYWLPSPSLLRPGPQMLVGAVLPDIQSLRDVSRILLCRALWHVGEGRPAEAWQDILAVHRLGRLLTASDGSGTTFISQLVAIAIGGSADRVITRHLLGSEDLPAEVVAAMRRDLDALGPPPTKTAGMPFERLLGVDAVVWIARRGDGGRATRMHGMMAAIGGGGSSWSPVSAALATSLDWNVVLTRMNAAYDGIEAAWQQPSQTARRKALERHQAEWIARASAASRDTWTALGHVMQLATNRGHRSTAVGDMIVGIVLPFGSWYLDATARSRAVFELSRTATSLAAWHADREPGSPPYPERLEDLVPRYLAEVPIDPFSDRPLLYARRGNGYVLFSVGQNGVDDGGDDFSGDLVDGEWQEPARGTDYTRSDIVVRMPGPPRLPLTASPEMR